MAAQKRPKPKISKIRPVKQTAVEIKEAQIKKTGFTPAKSEDRTRPKSKETLAETQKALRVAQTKVKRERQARIKAETALAEAQRALAIEQLDVKEERRTRLRRVSFIIRLTLDKQSQYVRTEIEHVSSSRKQKFPTLDGEGLVSFMNACERPTIDLEEAMSIALPPEKVTLLSVGPLQSKSSLMISNVQVFHPEQPDFAWLNLRSEKPLLVQVHFQLQGLDSISLTAQESSFEIKFYANEVINGKCKLLTTYNAKLTQSVHGYVALAQVPGLPSGVYRLFTVVILREPVKMAGFYGKTIINVT